MDASADAAHLAPVPSTASPLLDPAGPASRALLTKQVASSTGQDETAVAGLVEQVFAHFEGAAVRTYLNLLVEREVKRRIADGALDDRAAFAA